MVSNNVINEIGLALKTQYNIDVKMGFPSPKISGVYLREYNSLGLDSEGSSVDIQLLVREASTSEITAFNNSKSKANDIFTKIQSIEYVYLINKINLGYEQNANDYVINFTSSENI
jgi:hypothetical protein